MGNPGVRLMVPSARMTDVRTMGEEGKHARFSLHSGSHRALGVAFGRSSFGVDDTDMLDTAVRLEVNHWNGAVEPRVVLREVYPWRATPMPLPRTRAIARKPSGGRVSRPSCPAISPVREMLWREALA